MVKLRLFRVGTTKRPIYRIVAIDSRRRRQGRVLETLGTYDPLANGKVSLDGAAVEKWLSRGALPSDTVGSLIRKQRRIAVSTAQEGEPAPSTA